MRLASSPLLLCALLVSEACSAATPKYVERPRDVNIPTVDVGYALYSGHYDEDLDSNVFKGIRYAKPPTGNRRWQKPREPTRTDRKPIALDPNFATYCPQTPSAPSGVFSEKNEDCLYLSVVAPRTARDLPVMVWIHGGGYGGGGGDYYFNEMMRNSDNGFVYVNIQYRLGAFGFLSSAEVKEHGVANAGLWDQEFALRWVQRHISKFGGDPKRVTVAGESAGGGSVMNLALAHGGNTDPLLFRGVITQSPYLPRQWSYDDYEPTRAFTDFAKAAGCPEVVDTDGGSTLECLRAADSHALQRANFDVSIAGKAMQWRFVPVTDGEYLVDIPSKQLKRGLVNGERILTASNADEGSLFVPTNITSAENFTAYITDMFPLMSPSRLEDVEDLYEIAPVVDGTLFPTLGDKGPTALNQSLWATGEEQRAFNLYSETTFVCPSYWLADAYALKTGKAWMYQFSLVPGQHGLGLNALYYDGFVQPGAGTMSHAFRVALQKIWGHFIMDSDPRLSNEQIIALTTTDNGTRTGDNITAATADSWKEWDDKSHVMLNVNMTAPREDAIFAKVDGFRWEGGRGERCKTWMDWGQHVPQ